LVCFQTVVSEKNMAESGGDVVLNVKSRDRKMEYRSAPFHKMASP